MSFSDNRGKKLFWIRSPVDSPSPSPPPGMKKQEEEGRTGIVVIFAWSLIREKNLNSYVELYTCLGWNSLVCYADSLDAFNPRKATALAYAVLDELLEELRIRPCPVVIVAFSGGSKACMYKVFQIIEAKCDGQLNQDEHRLLMSCLSGHIFDSCPSDFTSDLGVRFALNPFILKMPGSSIMSWVAKGVASGLDALFLTRFDNQHTEYWQALYASIDMNAPYLILCSDSDDLAPYNDICNFAQRLRYTGGDVELVNWSGSPHAGHFETYPVQYKAAVTNLLEKATYVYYKKIKKLDGEQNSLKGMPREISELICDLQKVAVNSNKSLRQVAVGPGDHFFLPISSGYRNEGEASSIPDEPKEKLSHIPGPPSINPHSILGQVLFDACVPKNVEGWDIKFSKFATGQPVASSRRPFQGFNFIRRSRL